MKIVLHKKLGDFYSTPGYEDFRMGLKRWYSIVKYAEWNSLGDIKKDFPDVESVENQHYVFHLKGSKYQLVVVVNFAIGYVFIRCVGTHDEYDKSKCSII